MGYKQLIGIPLEVTISEARGDKGIVTIVSGESSINRDWETGKQIKIDPAGVRFENWNRAGGIVLWQHNFNIPVAKSQVFMRDDRLVAFDDLDFHRRKLPVATNNWIGDAVGEFDTAVVADLWEQHYINTVSVHVALANGDERNITETPDEIILGSSEMIEFSIVTIPADRRAEREQSHSRQVYEFALNKGGEGLAQCLTCFSPTQSNVEAQKMDEFLEVELDAEEIDLSVVVDEIVNDPQFAVQVAQALAANEQALGVLIEAVQAHVMKNLPTQQQGRSLRFTLKRDGVSGVTGGVPNGASNGLTQPVTQSEPATPPAKVVKRAPVLNLLGGGKK